MNYILQKFKLKEKKYQISLHDFQSQFQNTRSFEYLLHIIGPLCTVVFPNIFPSTHAPRFLMHLGSSVFSFQYISIDSNLLSHFIVSTFQDLMSVKERLYLAWIKKYIYACSMYHIPMRGQLALLLTKIPFVIHLCNPNLLYHFYVRSTLNIFLTSLKYLHLDS